MGNYLANCCNIGQESTDDTNNKHAALHCCKKEDPQTPKKLNEIIISNKQKISPKKSETKNDNHNFSILSVDDFEFKLWLKNLYKNKLAQVCINNNLWKKISHPRQNSNASLVKNLFVMKILSRGEIKIQDINLDFKEQVDNLIEYSHPFIIDLNFFFYDDQNLYFATEYVAGSDLGSYLRLFGSFSEKTAKFYIAEILIALEFIHNELDSPCYKLEFTQVLLDQQGHVKLADFGMKTLGIELSKKGTVAELLESNSIYFAPEVIEKHEQNNKISDYWSLGCQVFEMLNGKPAFSNNLPQNLWSQLIDGRASFSEKEISVDAKDFISEQLNPNHNERLGATNGIEEIKNHSFFEDVDWDMIYKKEIDPPFIPLLKVTKDEDGNLELN